MNHAIHFAPLLPISLCIAIGAALLLCVLLSIYTNPKRSYMRVLPLMIFILIILNPSWLKEDRAPLKNVAIIAHDQSPSQSFSNRTDQSQTAFETIKAQLSNRDDIDLRIIKTESDDNTINETRLFDQINQEFSDIAPNRRAGTIIISDGNIHDIPSTSEKSTFGPVHLLQTGTTNERDRRIVITNAPAYGLKGETVDIGFKIIDQNTDQASIPAVVTLTYGDQNETIRIPAPIGEEKTITVPLEHPGQNIFKLQTDEIKNEITAINNKTAVVVNAVRDRLKVLLVTGQPHAGARTWRDLLKADPGIDLVHFTILREPDKMDATPQNELSLIPFPFRELFEVKLYDFDLIIFDRYRQNYILPSYYFDNIVRYVHGGGALLLTAGPDFAGKNSLAQTSIGTVIPAKPSGAILNKPYTPIITERGASHPVTQPFTVAAQTWGQWLKQIKLKPNKTGEDILMSGTDSNPLIILDRVKQGRVAQIASDQIWLWRRQYDDGGPSTALLRRVVHWLMKEPELDETALTLNASGQSITITAYPDNNEDIEIHITKPDESKETLTLTKNENNIFQKTINADLPGVYGFKRPNGREQFVSIGITNPPEFTHVIATDDYLKPLINKSGGGVMKLHRMAEPNVKMLPASRNKMAGNTWVGLKQSESYTVTQSKSITLIPYWLELLLMAGSLLIAWWHEGIDKR